MQVPFEDIGRENRKLYWHPNIGFFLADFSFSFDCVIARLISGASARTAVFLLQNWLFVMWGWYLEWFWLHIIPITWNSNQASVSLQLWSDIMLSAIRVMPKRKILLRLNLASNIEWKCGRDCLIWAVLSFLTNRCKDFLSSSYRPMLLKAVLRALCLFTQLHSFSRQVFRFHRLVF